MNRPALAAALIAVAAAVVARRRQAQANTAQLWREATADASR